MESTRVRVAVRIRTLNKREQDSKCANIILSENNTLCIVDSKTRNTGNIFLPKEEHVVKFTFDSCYDEESSSQAKVSEDVGHHVMQCVKNGLNVSVIAFGQKGSGKTLTMMGRRPGCASSLHEDGVVQIVCKKLFSMESDFPDVLCTSQVSCLEIYDNQLIDLMFNERTSCPSELHIHEHPKYGPHVKGLTKYNVTSYRDFQSIINSSQMRQKSCTMDEHKSSRSHFIISIQHTQANLSGHLPNEITSKIDLVDLADRIAQHNNVNIKLNNSESVRINRCLFAFFDVIKSLSDVVDKCGTRRRSAYVPFRDSMLTWLLKESLGGNCATLMIATVSPADCNYNETFNTLQMANHAQRIINRPIVNEDLHVKRMKEIWEEKCLLQSSVTDSSLKVHFLEPMKQFVEIREKLQRNEELLHNMVYNWIRKWEGIAAVRPSTKELIETWRENQQRWTNSCGADSAFGSDIETEIDSKSFVDDFEKSGDHKFNLESCVSMNKSLSSSSSSLSFFPSSQMLNVVPQCRRRSSTEMKIKSRKRSDFSQNDSSFKCNSSPPHLTDSLRDDIKEKIRSLKHVERRQSFICVNQEPVEIEDTKLMIVTESDNRSNPNKEAEDDLKARLLKSCKEILRKNTAVQSLRNEKNSLKTSEMTAREICYRSSDFLSSDISFLFSLLSKEFHEISDKVTKLLTQQQSNVIFLRNFVSNLVEDVAFRVSKVKTWIDRLKKMIQNPEEKNNFSEKLKKYERMVATMERILYINQLLLAVQKDLYGQEFKAAVDKLDEIHTLITGLDEGGAENCIAQNASEILQTELCIARERIIHNLAETWNRMIKWHIPSKNAEEGTRPWTVSLDLSLLHWRNDIASKLVQTMDRVGLLDSRIDNFCDHLMLHCIQKLVRNRSTLIQVVTEAERYIAHVTSQTVQRNVSSSAAVTVEVFHKMEQIFLFLHYPMSRIKIMNHSKEITLMEKVGNVMSKKMFECIYSECLVQMLQKSGVQWVTFNQVAKATEMFEETMAKLGLVSCQQTPLTEYLNTVGNQFGHMKSQELLKKAHDFVTSDLQEFQQISVDHPLGLAVKRSSIEREEFVRACKEKVRTANYKLPTCQISVPVRSLVCLAYDSLKEASDGSCKGASLLCRSVHSMFELYCDMVPFYHNEKLRTIPLLAALHHNNCMFVAHHLITIDKVFRRELVPSKAKNEESVPTSTDERESKTQLGVLVPKIRRLGNEGFGQHIHLKQEEMCSHLCQADGFNCAADHTGEGAMNAVHEMAQNLKQICTVWKNVLPINTYHRAIGSLLNSALKDIIDSIVTIDEFSIDDCQHLQKVLSFLLDFVPDLFFSDHTEVTIQENVLQWMKFQELVLFLGFSLKDIDNRWADGKGPLAMHFTSAEIAKMVVAMFENTSKRNALITQLKRKPSVHKR